MMKKYFLSSFLMSVSALSYADTAPSSHYYSLQVNHVPPQVQIIKKCGNMVQTQSSNMVSEEKSSKDSYSYSSSMSMSSSSIIEPNAKEAKSTDCTFIIRSLETCSEKQCERSVDFKTMDTKKP